MAGVAPEFEDEANYYTRQNEARPASYDFDQRSINTDVYVQPRTVFVLFESPLNAVLARRAHQGDQEASFVG